MTTTIRNLTVAISMLAAAGALAETAPPTPPAPAAPAAAESAGGAKIQFDVKDYDFGKTKSGDPIKHTFYFTNTGDATLELSNVRPGCGCTTAGEWTKKVEPGKSGSIPIQVATVNFNGPVTKSVTVDCNDKSQGEHVTLLIKGTIWKPVDVNPQFAWMRTVADNPIASSIVRIVNNMDEPLTLSPPEVNNKSFTAELTTLQTNKEFQLTIKPTGPLTPGSVQGQVTIKTSSTNVPLLTVTCVAQVDPVIAINPPQLTLPSGPLPVANMPTITIQNNSTNLLKLSDAAVNAKDVGVEVSESQPGRSFVARLSFPQGFEIEQGKQIEFAVKTSNPQQPLLKVPIMQAAKPIAPVVPVKPTPPTGAAVSRPVPQAASAAH